MSAEPTIGLSPTGQSLAAPPRPLRVVVREREQVSPRERARRLSRVLGVRAAGWAFLGLLLLTAALGWGLGWWELRVAAVAALVVAVAAVLFTLGRPRYDVGIELPARRVVAGTPAEGRLRVTNAADRRLLGSRMDLRVGAEDASFALPSLAPREPHAVAFALPTERRGVVVVGPAKSVQGDPFGLTGRERRWSEPLEVFVHPRTVSLPGRQSGFVHDLEGHSTNEISASDMSFHALREYVPGDDRRHVHWRSTARTGTLMVRQFEETRQSRIAVGLDLARRSYASDDEFELAVSAAGSLALQAVREDNPLAVIAGERSLPAISAARALDELSRVQPDARHRAADVISTVTRQEPNASIVAYLTGSGLGLLDVRKAAANFSIDARVLAIRCALGAATSVRTTGNVTLIELGALADMPGAIRRAIA